MKLIECPLNGLRNASEFQCAGPVRAVPEAVGAGDRAWSEHLHFDDNVAGVVLEWWCHLPSTYWFIVERDTRTDAILRTYAPSERPDLTGRDLTGRDRSAQP
jgi:sarcosine oxidase subunit delta